eukprot:1289999-Prymnesium_polylepis.1
MMHLTKTPILPHASRAVFAHRAERVRECALCVADVGDNFKKWNPKHASDLELLNPRAVANWLAHNNFKKG